MPWSELGGSPWRWCSPRPTHFGEARQDSAEAAGGVPLHGPLSGVVQAAAAMALIVLGVRLALTDRFPDGLSLVVLVAVGVVTYVPLCRWRAPEVAREIRRLRRERGLQSDVG